MAAVSATLDVLERENGQQKLWDKAQDLYGYIAPLTSSDLPKEFHGKIVVGEPPFNRVSFHPTPIGNVWRKLMISHGVLIYAAHNLSLAHDDNAKRKLLDVWVDVVEVLPEVLAEMDAIEEEEHNTIMRR